MSLQGYEVDQQDSTNDPEKIAFADDELSDDAIQNDLMNDISTCQVNNPLYV